MTESIQRAKGHASSNKIAKKAQRSIQAAEVMKSPPD
jgi:hypothetical protein